MLVSKPTGALIQGDIKMCVKLFSVGVSWVEKMGGKLCIWYFVCVNKALDRK